MYSKILFILTLCLLILFFSNTPKEQMVKTMSQQKYCLDRIQTENDNKIKIGNGYLVLNANKTFIVKNDSAVYSNLSGKWDLCCWGSDYGNFHFEVAGLPKWEQASPNFYVLVQGKKLRLFFRICK